MQDGVNGKGSVLDIETVDYIHQGEICPWYHGLTLQLLGRKVSLLLGPDTTLIGK